MKRTIIITAALLLGLTALAQQQREYTLPYNLSESEQTASMAAGVVYDDLLTISGKDGIGGLLNMIPAFNGSYLRGVGSYQGGTYVVLVDGIERSAGELRCQEIESITVLKDAASLALYGLRGAEGAVLVKTKRGAADVPIRIKADYHYGMDFRYGMPEMATSAEYMQAVNEALANDGLSPRYSLSDISNVAAGVGPLGENDRANDWESIGLRKFSDYHDLVLSAEGRLQGIRYYTLVSYTGSHGMNANVHYNDGYTLQNLGSTLNFRTNLEARLNGNMTLNARVKYRQGQSQYSNGGVLGGIYSVPKFLFPQQINGVWTRSQMFGNPAAGYLNGGYGVSLSRSLYADIALVTDLDEKVKGLKWTLNVSYDHSGTMYDSHSIGYKQYYITYNFDPHKATGYDDYTLDLRGNDTGMGFSGGGMGSLNNKFSGWATIDYARTFGKHGVNADLVYSMKHFKGLGGTNVSAYMDFVFKGAYNYDNRYIIDFAADYCGSGRLPKEDRFVFLPAVGVAWIASNESFLKDSDFIDFLKIRASWGKTADDQNIAYDMDKQFNGSGGAYIFMANEWKYGYVEGSMPSSGIVPEIDTKSNVGFDAKFLDAFSFTTDAFYNHRTNIQGSAGGDYSSVLGIGMPTIFTGECASWGAEFSLGYVKKFGDFKLDLLATANYCNNKILYVPQGYVRYDWQNRIGTRIGSNYHYEADGFYTADDFNADGSLKDGVVRTTLIDKVQPGDIKYKDLNGDGIIDGYDNKYWNFSADPYWNFGLKLGGQYKQFGLDMIFTGCVGSYADLMVDHVTRVLVDDSRNISKYALDNYWCEGREDTATLPRLTTLSNANNYATSTFWLRKSDRMRFEILYLYYDLGQDTLNRMKVGGCRFYLRGRNLFTLAGVKPFVFDNIGTGYATRSFELGANLSF